MTQSERLRTIELLIEECDRKIGLCPYEQKARIATVVYFAKKAIAEMRRDPPCNSLPEMIASL